MIDTIYDIATQSPRQTCIEINNIYNDKFLRPKYEPKGIDYFAEDWDNLLIFDACRFDFFQEAITEYDIDGELTCRISGTPGTPQWLERNVDNRDLSDAVYLTASSMHYFKLMSHDDLEYKFHKIIDLWDKPFADNDVVDRLVTPEQVNEWVPKMIEKYPNKRLVVHYNQPHKPYIDSEGKPRPISLGPETPRWKLRDAYRTSLARLLSQVESMISELPGKTVITADHGELLGERTKPIPIREYEHPYRYVPELMNVPWFEIPSTERRDIQPGEIEEYSEKQPETLNNAAREHLKTLGYL